MMQSLQATFGLQATFDSLRLAFGGWVKGFVCGWCKRNLVQIWRGRLMNTPISQKQSPTDKMIQFCLENKLVIGLLVVIGALFRLRSTGISGGCRGTPFRWTPFPTLVRTSR